MKHDLYSINTTCSGRGVNHEGQPFFGFFELKPVVNGKGAQLYFRANGLDGTVFHEESTIVGPGFDGKPCLFVLSTNHPAVTPHPMKQELRDANSHVFVFGFGDLENKNSFREEIQLSLFSDGTVEYKYSWGLPGGEFAERSSVRMSHSNTPL